MITPACRYSPFCDLGVKMRKLLLVLVLALAFSTPALADNSRFYGLWQVTGKIGSYTIDPFLFALGDRDYSANVSVQWQGFGDAGWVPTEWVENGNYFYSKMARDGNFLWADASFVDSGWASGHPGWVVRGMMYTWINGDDITLDVYLCDPSKKPVHKYTRFEIDMNDSLTQANITAQLFDYTNGFHYYRATGTMEKIGRYEGGQFILN